MDAALERVYGRLQVGSGWFSQVSGHPSPLGSNVGSNSRDKAAPMHRRMSGTVVLASQFISVLVGSPRTQFGGASPSAERDHKATMIPH